MPSQNPQEVSPRPAQWDSSDLPIKVPAGFTWGVPPDLLEAVWRLLQDDEERDGTLNSLSYIERLGGPAKRTITFRKFQRLVAYLYRRGLDTVPLREAIEDALLALEDREAAQSSGSSQKPDSFKKQVEKIYQQRKSTVLGDIQKNRWGGKNIRKGKTLKARVRAVHDRFEVTLEVLAEHSKYPLTGFVAFFSNSDEILYSEAKAPGGIASVTVMAAEAFTAGAMAEDGSLLELDLQEIKGFPSEFYYEKRKSSKKK